MNTIHIILIAIALYILYNYSFTEAFAMSRGTITQLNSTSTENLNEFVCKNCGKYNRRRNYG